MNTQELLYKIQNLPNVTGITVQATMRERCDVEECVWQVNATYRDKKNGNDKTTSATNDNLDLALATILLVVDPPKHSWEWGYMFT